MKSLILLLTPLLALTSATPLKKRWPTSAKLTPAAISQYTVNTGAINYDTTKGLVSKPGNGNDITTLVTFNIPALPSGTKCSLAFYLPPDSSSIATGSKKLDIFSSNGPAPGSRSTWPPGNQRNQHLGRWNVVVGSDASWESGFPITGQSFDCPVAGSYGYEVVGVYDLDRVEWDGGVGGVYMMW
ncbi:hypothetical protein CC78DRAFT_529672 [Lojkania enalia]|uniref:Ubiquitin 3 binding protein But2 C-terminal domain-containing protein n=1 Tax=Lojkania enalia TaxID=147567 RepID=A0A9P4KH32_9PLEO|nr:hypothetical protein CC78DRAFT_529672 [Didymosphaeria enalia]